MLLASMVVIAAYIVGGHVGWYLARRCSHSIHYRPLRLEWRQHGNLWRIYDHVAVDYRNDSRRLARMEVVDLASDISLVSYHPMGCRVQAIIQDGTTLLATPAHTAEAAKQLRARQFGYQTVWYNSSTCPLPDRTPDVDNYQGMAEFSLGAARLSLYRNTVNNYWLLVWVNGGQPQVSHHLGPGDVIEAANQAMLCMFEGGSPRGDLWPI